MVVLYVLRCLRVHSIGDSAASGCAFAWSNHQNAASCYIYDLVAVVFSVFVIRFSHSFTSNTNGSGSASIIARDLLLSKKRKV